MKDNIILFIDTSNNKEIVVGLKMNHKEDLRKKVPNHRKSQVVLPMIETVLKENQLTLKELTAIEVYPGPGSFTGLRVGITIANTLSQLLDIPINGKRGQTIKAIYS